MTWPKDRLPPVLPIFATFAMFANFEGFKSFIRWQDDHVDTLRPVAFVKWIASLPLGQDDAVWSSRAP